MIPVIDESNASKTKYLNIFAHWQIVRTKDMSQSILKIVHALVFSQATVARVYWEYISYSKTLPRNKCYGQQHLNDRSHIK